MAQNGGNSDALMTNPSGDVLYPLHCRVIHVVKSFMKKRMSQNLENYPMKTLKGGKLRNVVRSFVRKLKEMPRAPKILKHLSYNTDWGDDMERWRASDKERKQFTFEKTFQRDF